MKKTTYLKFTSIILLVLLLGIYIGYSATPSNPIWISGGEYPRADYTIWRDGSNYFTKDVYGRIIFDGTNATTLIQNTINGASGGESIHFASGLYADLGPITLKSNISIIGAGQDYHNVYSTVFQARTGFTGNLFDLTGAGSGSTGWTGYLTLKNFVINMTKATSGNGIFLKYCLRNIIDNVQIRRAKTYALYLDSVEQTRITNCFFHGSDQADIYLYWASTIYIAFNEFASSASTSRGILSSKSEANIIFGNTFYFHKYAIAIYNDSNLTSIDNNMIWQTQRTGIYLYGGYYNTFSNNNLFDCGSSGAYYAIHISDSNHTKVNGAVILNMDTAYQTHGIMEDGTSDFTDVLNCDTYSVTTLGIMLSGASSHAGFSWNRTTWIS